MSRTELPVFCIFDCVAFAGGAGYLGHVVIIGAVFVFVLWTLPPKRKRALDADKCPRYDDGCISHDSGGLSSQ